MAITKMSRRRSNNCISFSGGAETMHGHLFRLAISLAMVFCCLACAAKRPILSPNEHLIEMGPEAAQRDVDECLRLAAEAGPGAARGKQVAGQTAGGAAVGAAAGAVAGAISGGPGIGAAAGAASGATAGLLHGLFRWSGLDAGQQRYVEDCLRQKGYNPEGWQ
jgi:outer membrane lipoprotein SlyB